MPKSIKIAPLALLLILAAGCASKIALLKKDLPKDSRKSYTVLGKTYFPMKTVKPGYSQTGIASWYGPGFHGRKTATGEIYNMHMLTAAHDTLPLNSVVKVTNMLNNKHVVVRINDRGPFVDNRLIDLSLASAKKLGLVGPGTAPVRLTVLKGGVTMIASKKSAPTTDDKRIARAPNPFFTRGVPKLLALTKIW
jgi:peptidoglycan lytic transglycosylase